MTASSLNERLNALCQRDNPFNRFSCIALETGVDHLSPGGDFVLTYQGAELYLRDTSGGHSSAVAGRLKLAV